MRGIILELHFNITVHYNTVTNYSLNNIYRAELTIHQQVLTKKNSHYKPHKGSICGRAVVLDYIRLHRCS